MAAEFLPVVAEWFRETYGQPTYPQLHGWHTWDGVHVRQSEAAGPLQEAGFYGDGPRLLWDGYPGPRPRS